MAYRVYCLTFLFLLPSAIAGAQTRSYSVGNSFTNDGFYFRNNDYSSGFEAITSAEGLSHETGNHIRCGSSLGQILANPDGTCMDARTPYGKFSNALPGYHWDFVTMQPHPSGGATLGEDQASIKSLIDLTRLNPANSDTVFYIYATWPKLSSGSYANEWLGSSENAPEAPMRIRREYYDNLLANVRSETEAPVYLIPTGDVFLEINKKIEADEVPGISSIADFHRDDLHLNLRHGRYTAALSIFATTFKTSPLGVARPDGFYSNDSAQSTPGLTDIIQQTVWDVVANDPNTGYADLNNDETVDGLDLDLWETGYGGTEALAKTGDDFLIWQRTFTPPPAMLTAVPEPSAGLLCLLGFAGLVARRRVPIEARR